MAPDYAVRQGTNYRHIGAGWLFNRTSKRALAGIAVDYVMGYNPENVFTSWFLSWLATKLGVAESEAEDWETVDSDVFFD